MASRIRQVAGSASVFWTITTLTCTSQIALIALTIGLATNNASVADSIHRTTWATAAANMVALTASLGAVCLYVRRTARTVYLVLCAIFALLSALAALLTIYTLTWLWNYVGEEDHPNKRYVFTENLAIAGFAVWSVAFIAQAILYTLVFWPKNYANTQPTPQELTERPSPSRPTKRRLSDLTSLTPPSTPLYIPHASESSKTELSPTTLSPKSSFSHSVHAVIHPMTSKTKLLIRQTSFPRDSASLNSTRETSLEALRQDDGFETWDTSAVEEIDDGRFLPRSARLRLETIPGSRPVSPANPLNGPFPDIGEDDVRLPESPAHSPVNSPSSETSSLRFSRPPTRPDSSASQAFIHPLFRSESPVPPPVASPGTVITASPYAGQVVSSENLAFAPRKLHSSQSFRADSPSPLSPNRSRQGSFRSIQAPQSSHGEQRSATPQFGRLAQSPEPEDRGV